MNIQLAEKIIKEIEKFSTVRCALVNDLGETVAKSSNFKINHPILNVKGNKSIPLKTSQKNWGYLYLDENLDTVKETGPILKSMSELIIEQEHHTQVLTTDEKRVDQITYDYLYTELIEAREYQKVIKSFGIELNRNRTAIFLEVCDGNFLRLYEKEVVEGEREKIVARVKRSLESLLSYFYTKHTDNLIFYLGGQNFLILKDMGNDPLAYQDEFKKTLNNLHYNIEQELRTKVTIGVGEYKEGIEGLKESFNESRTALKFGEQTWGSDKIFHYDNFGVVAPLFSGANKENITISRDIVKKLSKNEDLAKTLNAYLKNDLSLSKTAKELKIHRNTLVYRLGRIEELTELDPKLFNDAFQLQVALILDKYHA